MNNSGASGNQAKSRFQPRVFVRKGEFCIKGALKEVFPLLCPKKEEDWIPGWKCETIYSKSGYNEEGAIFRTTEPYGTELYWTTLQYDIERKHIDFLLNAPRLFNFRFTISLDEDEGGLVASMAQTFTSLSEEGNAHVERISEDDFQNRLHLLEACINTYLQTGTMIQRKN
jgi:hypothetical protein